MGSESHPADTAHDPRSRWHIDLYADGCCVYELDREGEILRIAAWAPNALTARAAYDQLVAANSGQSFSCRRRSWVMAEHIGKKD